MTTQQMIDAIRKGEKLGHAAMQDIANKLESQHGQLAEYKQHFEYNQDIAAKRDAYKEAVKWFCENCQNDKEFCETGCPAGMLINQARNGG